MSFMTVIERLEQTIQKLYLETEQKLICYLTSEFGEDYHNADGRSIAALFRRFEFVEKVLGTKSRLTE